MMISRGKKSIKVTYLGVNKYILLKIGPFIKTFNGELSYILQDEKFTM